VRNSENQEVGTMEVNQQINPFVFFKIANNEYLIGFGDSSVTYRSNLIGLEAAYRCIANPDIAMNCIDLTASQYPNTVLRNSIRNVALNWIEKNVPDSRPLTHALYRITVSGNCCATYIPADFSAYIKTKP
jgi:hypothetical protein